MEVILSEELKNEYPNIKIGILEVRGVTSKRCDPRLEREKRLLEAYIRKNYTNPEEIDVIKSYNRFFKKYGKVYPIQFQIQSILKGKLIPTRSTVVEAMFMAELKNMYLTAGHDLDSLNGPLETRLADGSESYVKINGKEQRLKPGDIYTRDRVGIISSVLYGPDYRTRIRDDTKNCLFFSYLPYGEEDVNIKRHLRNILDNLRIFMDEEPEVVEIRIYQ